MKDEFKQGDIVVFVQDAKHDCRYANYGGTPASRPRLGTIGILLHVQVPSVWRERATFVNIAYLDREFTDKIGLHPVFSLDSGWLRNTVRPADDLEQRIWEENKLTYPGGALKYN